MGPHQFGAKGLTELAVDLGTMRPIHHDSEIFDVCCSDLEIPSHLEMIGTLDNDIC